MKSFRFFVFAAALAAAFSCAPSARIDGVLKDAPDAEVVVGLLDINRFQTLDTIKTNASGAYSYKLDIEKGQPEFIYLYYKDTRIASLLLEAGDKVRVESDTLGNYSVEGSEESLLLKDVEKDYADFIVKMASGLDRAEFSKTYVDYYRKCVAYIMGHSHSLTVVPVFFQNVGEGFPVFNQRTDALLFSSTLDSLKMDYPESKYVKALEKEARTRMNALELGMRIDAAGETGYVDFELPDIKGDKVRLSDIDAKVVLLYFWAATDEMKMYNLDVLKPLYEQFHKKGLEIFAISFDVDKTDWANVMKNQNLPWINVCDIRGNKSPLLGFYAVSGLPQIEFLVGGQIDTLPEKIDLPSLRKYISSKL